MWIRALSWHCYLCTRSDKNYSDRPVRWFAHMHIFSITIPATKDIGTWPMSPDSIGDHVISVDTTLRILTSCSAFPTVGYRRAFIMTRSGMNGIVPPGRLTSRGAVEMLSGTTAHALPQCHSFSFVIRCHKFIALCNKNSSQL